MPSDWLSCFPLDTIKNRIQAAPDVLPPKYVSPVSWSGSIPYVFGPLTPPTRSCRYNGMRGAATAIYAEAGLRGFFKGFVPCVLRAFPANAACFMAYEVALSVLPEVW